MKIFLSHSSKQKLFVKELRRYLPNHINLWIDEKEILIGSNLETKIEEGISKECDYFIIIIDSFAIKSPWVLHEMELAMEKEKKIKRSFLLPIVLELNAWDELSHNSIKGKKYLSCLDFMDTSIEALAKSLITELIGWLCFEFENNKLLNSETSRQNEELTYLKILNEADKLSEEYTKEIKRLILPYRRNNPISINSLFEAASTSPQFYNFQQSQFSSLLSKLQSKNHLRGIYFDGEILYLQRESYEYKEELYNNVKKIIANRAFDFIHSGQIIAIDGGSTTLELTKKLCNAIKLNDLYDLTVVTNSLITVNELLNTLSELNVRDFNDVCNVYLIGGRARSISFTMVPESKNVNDSKLGSIQTLLEGFQGADIAFLGTNGIKKGEGFAISNVYELKAKVDMVKYSRKKVILCDPSKFIVEQERVFANFNDDLTIVTMNDGKNEDIISGFKQQLINKNSELIVC